MKATKYTLLLTSYAKKNDPGTIILPGGDDLKELSHRAEDILLALADIHGLYEFVDDAIYAIDHKTHDAVFVVAIRDSKTGETIYPEL